MTLRNWKKLKKLNVRLLQPQLPVCGPRINELLSLILQRHFPQRPRIPIILFGRTPTLAHIEHSDQSGASTIWLHHALNDEGTPDWVFSFILKHELLHTQILPREVDGKWSAHPPEFWEEEIRLCDPDERHAWEWISSRLGLALKRDNEHECIWVNNRRMTEVLRNRHCAEQDLDYLRSASQLRKKELRFGFREQALRDFSKDGEP